MLRKRLALAGVFAALAVVGPLAGTAGAQQADIAEITRAVDEVWLVVAAALVMFMQAGFAMVEAGFTRAKNAANIIMKNLMDFSVGALMFWAVGWAIAYGTTEVINLFAYGDFFITDPSKSAIWFFQVVFAATAATIISGAVAERTKFSAYLLYTPVITGIIYPVVVNWGWGEGFLSPFRTIGEPFGPTGFLDFAGSGIVHMVGGIAALAAVLVLGPRIGKYDDNGKPLPIPGHSLTLGALGVFILWFGWYGFNAGSTLAAVGADFASVAVTTTLSAAAGALSAMVTGWTYPVYGKPDVGLTLNGALAGLVGITAGAGYVTNVPAVIIGLVAGFLVVVSIVGLERIGVDDPVGAISVHGTAGIWGVIAVGLFANVGMVESLGWAEGVGGIFVGGGAGLLGTQVAAVVVIAAWVFTSSYAVFKLIDKTIGMRVSPEEEIAGLDRMEHGMEAYPEFLEQVAPAELLDPVND
jgi:Amt family ammonium transporter